MTCWKERDDETRGRDNPPASEHELHRVADDRVRGDGRLLGERIRPVRRGLQSSRCPRRRACSSPTSHRHGRTGDQSTAVLAKTAPTFGHGRGLQHPLGRVLAGANRHDSPLLAPTLDKLDDLGPLPADITVHLDSGYHSGKTRDELAGRGLRGQIAHKGEKAPIQTSGRRHVERTNSWHNAFNRLQRCYKRREHVIDAFFDLADAIITVRALIRQAWTTHRRNTRPRRRP